MGYVYKVFNLIYLIMKIAFKKFIPWIILVLVVGGAVAWYFITNRVTASQNASYDQIIQEADTWYEGKEYSTAMVKYYEAADLIPSRYAAFRGVVTILIEKNRVNDALSLIDNSARKVPAEDQARLYLQIGNAYFVLGNYDKSLDTYKKGIALDGKNQDLELALGKTYVKKGNTEEAKKYLSSGMFTEDNQSEAMLLLGYIQSVSDSAGAKTTVESITPTDKWKAYYDEFKTVLDSLNTDTKFNATKLARIYVNNGYPYLAISILEPMEADISEYVEGVYFLGRGYLDYGNYPKAIEEFDKAVTLGSMEGEILWAQARAEIGNNNLDNAISDYSKALGYIGKTPSKAFVSEYLDVLLKNDQSLKASDVLQSVSQNIKEAYVYIYGVKINYANNSNEKINYYIGLLSKMTLTGEDLKEYLYWNSKSLLDQNGDLTKVETLLNALLNEDRYNAKYYLLQGKFEIAKGNSEEAANAFKKAIEYDLSNSLTDEATSLLSTVD